MERNELQWVMVEAVSQFRTRYMVQVPTGIDDHGNDKSTWALDTVTLNEAEEFSSHYLGEIIVSHRVVTTDEALKISDQDNDYTSAWTNEKKMEVFFTPWKETDVV